MPWVTTVYTPVFGRANNQWQLLLPGLFEDCRPMRYQPLDDARKRTNAHWRDISRCLRTFPEACPWTLEQSLGDTFFPAP